MNVVLSFEESVKGTKKVKNHLFRSLSIRRNVCVQLAMEKDVNQELNHKNVEVAQEKEHKLSNKECLLCKLPVNHVEEKEPKSSKFAEIVKEKDLKESK